jgi:hypothetical protein
MKFTDASNICSVFGGAIASMQQLNEGQKKGADWCLPAYLNDGSVAYPVSTARAGCVVGVNALPQKGARAVNCYGRKQPSTSFTSTVLKGKAYDLMPFDTNKHIWSMIDGK